MNFRLDRDSAPGVYVFCDRAARSNEHVVADLYWPEYAGEGANLHSVSNGGVPLARRVAADAEGANRDTAEYIGIVSNPGGLPDYRSPKPWSNTKRRPTLLLG